MSLKFSTDYCLDYNAQIGEGLLEKLAVLTDRDEDFSAEALYALENDTLIGGIVFFQYDTILWIDQMWVKASHRRRGVGQKLMTQIYQLSIEREKTEIQLHTYFIDAYHFYQKMGFETVAVVPRWKYGLTYHLLQKKL